MNNRPCLRVALLAAAFATSAAYGQVNIDTAAAMAGGITPGDAPGFPVTLSVPGSYRVTSNLTTTLLAPSTLIDITGTNVSLDLNGFTVGGPYACAATGALSTGNTCTTGSDPPLIYVQGRAARIHGGFVDGGGGFGIQSYFGMTDISGGPTIEDVIVSNHRGRGIQLSTSGNTVRNVSATSNQDGVFAGSEAIVEGVRASRNNGYGLRLGNRSVANKAVTRLNAGAGVVGGSGVVSQLHTAANGLAGYSGGAAVTLSLAQDNGAAGFNGPVMLTQSVTRANGGDGYTGAPGGSCYANVRSESNAGAAITAATGFVGTLAICP